MINPTACLEQLKFEIGQNLNLPVFTTFCNLPLPLSKDKTSIIEIKNIKQDQIKLSIKIIIDKTEGYESCLSLTSKLIKVLYKTTNFDVVNLQTMPLNFDKASRTLCQETQVTLKELEPQNNLPLIFGSETIYAQNSTALKIARQTINLGSTIDNDALIFDFQKPIKKIEGCAQTNLQQFNSLLNSLNLKKVEPLTFKELTFNATLTELTLNFDNQINFKFMEVDDSAHEI